MALRVQQQGQQGQQGQGQQIKSYSPFSKQRERGGGAPSAPSAPRGPLVPGDVALVRGGKRRDGRSPEECRPAFIKLGTVSQASGSAYMEFGRTKVLVSVFGPRESRGDQSGAGSSGSGRLVCTASLAPFARATRRPRDKRGSPEEQELARALQSALAPAVQLHSFPKACVEVSGLVLEAGGSEVAVLVQCASAALTHAGIQLYDLVSCATVSVWRDQLLLDPSDEEEACEEGSLTLAMMPTADQVTLMAFSGDLAAQHLAQALELAMGGCLKLDEMTRATVKEEMEALLTEK